MGKRTQRHDKKATRHPSTGQARRRCFMLSRTVRGDRRKPSLTSPCHGVALRGNTGVVSCAPVLRTVLECATFRSIPVQNSWDS